MFEGNEVGYVALVRHSELLSRDVTAFETKIWEDNMKSTVEKRCSSQVGAVRVPGVEASAQKKMKESVAMLNLSCTRL